PADPELRRVLLLQRARGADQRKRRHHRAPGSVGAGGRGREADDGAQRRDALRPAEAGDAGDRPVVQREGHRLLALQQVRGLGGEQAVSADELRDTMIELKGEAAEPLEPERFPNLLRQAHDAEIIDLSKEEDGAYAVKLRPGEASAPDAGEEAVVEMSQPPNA